MNLNEWKSFKVKKIFVMENGKGITKEEINDNKGTFTVVQSGEENNGVLGKIDLDYCKQMKYTFSIKPCLTVARTGSAGFVSFQYKGCVVGDSAKILLLNDEVATTEHYLFLQSILNANRFKYTYGRKVTEEKYMIDYIKLPVQYNENGTIFIDSCKKYSDEGYVPDWKFMENYIKSLHYKPLTTKNKSDQVPDLNVDSWKYFSIIDLFEIKRGNIKFLNEIEIGNVPIVSASGDNEGISFYGNVLAPYCNNITISMNGVNTGFTAYHGYNFNINADCCVLIQKFDMNVYIGEFVATIIGMLRYKYS